MCLCSNRFDPVTRPTGTYESSYSSSKLEVMSGARSAASVADIPASSAVRAMVAGEVARSARRSQSVRRLLAQPALSPWLTLVDQLAPGLVDVERLRLAEIIRRNATNPEPQGA
jgi:hypothetical protein